MFLITQRSTWILGLLVANALATYTVVVTRYTTTTICPVTETVTSQGQYVLPDPPLNFLLLGLKNERRRVLTQTRMTTSTITKTSSKTVTITATPVTLTEYKNINVTSNATEYISVTATPPGVRVTELSIATWTETVNKTIFVPPHTTTTIRSIVTSTYTATMTRGSGDVYSESPPSTPSLTETAAVSPPESSDTGSHSAPATAASSSAAGTISPSQALSTSTPIWPNPDSVPSRDASGGAVPVSATAATTSWTVFTVVLLALSLV